MVGAGHDDGGERTKDRARERRHDDVGQGRRRASSRAAAVRRAVGDALEHVVGPARELGQRQRLDAFAERRAPRGRERRLDAERGERLAAGVVVAELREHAPALERAAHDIEPAERCRRDVRRDRVERGRRFGVEARRAGGSASDATPSRRRDAAAPADAASSDASEPPRASPAGGRDLSQSR